MSGATWAIFMMTFESPYEHKDVSETKLRSGLIRPASTRPLLRPFRKLLRSPSQGRGGQPESVRVSAWPRRRVAGRACVSPTPRSARSRSWRSKRSAARSPSTTASSTRSAAILVVGALIFLTSLPIAYYAATYGVDIDLLTRGAGFGYHRIDHHVADLRLLHLPVLRHRSGDHVARARNVLRHPAVPRLRAQLACRHSAGHARHHLHQPLPAVDAADLDRAPSPSVRVHRRSRQRVVRTLDQFHRACRRRRPIVQPASCSAPPRRWCSR